MVIATLLAACGPTPPRVAAPSVEHDDASPAPIFASHGAVTLRSESTDAGAPFHAELSADGSITGTRCGATRLSDDGALEREGAVVARVVEQGDELAILAADDRDTGWHIAGDVLSASGETRFHASATGIRADDPQLPTIAVDPPTTSPRVALALFAALLVCDDLGP
jgi:hypothetical protein